MTRPGRTLQWLFGNRISTVMQSSPLVGLLWGLGTSQTGYYRLRWVLVMNGFLEGCIVGWWHLQGTCLRPPNTAFPIFVHIDQQTCGRGCALVRPSFLGVFRGALIDSCLW